MFNILFPKKQYTTGGYMLMQLIIGIVIIIILASITTLRLSSFTEAQALNNTVDDVTALLNQARSRTISADAGATYGVHIESGQEAFTLYDAVAGWRGSRGIALRH